MKKPNGYWNKDRCKEEALKYSTKKEFSINSGSAYYSAKRLKIIDDICSHMELIGNRFKRCIYVYEFSDNSAYIGLTYNLKNRDIRHKRNIKSTVYKKINKNFKYNLKQLTEYIEIEKSKELENFYVEEYKKNKWTILNKRKTGGLGGNILKWTKEKCIEEALKYTTRNDFKKYSATSYGVSCKNKWLNDICQHMIKSPFTQSGYWTKEKCQKEALKYTTRNDFRKNNPNAYSPCCDHKWLDDVCSHMNGRKINGYWTKEKCQKEALKYNKKSSYKKSEPTSYRISRENGWLNEICLHMIKKKN